MENRKKQNTDEDYNKALVSDDPTSISSKDLEDLAKKAMKKFESLG